MGWSKSPGQERGTLMASKSDIIGVERIAIIDRAAPSGGFVGWTNQPTWNVALLLSNDEGLMSESQYLVSSEYAANGIYAAADALEAWCRDMDSTEPTTFVDRISWDFVNWSEVAFSILDDVAETL